MTSLHTAEYHVVQLHVADIERDFRRARDADYRVGRALRRIARTVAARRG